ncbi:MAG TPA: DinB family protein [Candidatus Acidoferrales bacterium]
MKSKKTAKKKATKKARKQPAGAKNNNADAALRKELKAPLLWGDAHVDWKTAVADLPAEKRGVRPLGFPYSAWELLEHARIAQRDILEFCVDPKYKPKEWPAAYWPGHPAPPNAEAWDKTVAEFEAETQEMARLVENARIDLLAKITHGSGQTLLREALLLADHNAYHLGQFVLVRRALGAWKET